MCKFNFKFHLRSFTITEEIIIILSCKDICKSYGIRDVLKNITFSINEGDKVGIIGANGEGKSTLFKNNKELSQDSGEVFIDKNKH